MDDNAFRLKQQHEFLFEKAPYGVALASNDGKWLKVNAALCSLVGYTESELLNTDFQSITHPQDIVTDEDMLKKLVLGELVDDMYVMEKRYIHKRGYAVWVTLTVRPVRDEDGSCTYLVSIVQPSQAINGEIKVQGKVTDRSTITLLPSKSLWLFIRSNWQWCLTATLMTTGILYQIIHEYQNSQQEIKKLRQDLEDLKEREQN